MARLYLFADEAGDFEFSRRANVSRYFILCTVTMTSCAIGHALLDLRRRLAWERAPLGEYFHATTDKQVIRDAVFAELANHDFHVQATIMEKAKAQPQVRADKPRFYQYGWYFHFRHGLRSHLFLYNELLATAASLGTRREKTAFSDAVQDVLQQLAGIQWRTNFCPASSDPCVQVADYCAWAIQRKWEQNDPRSYALIANRISYQYDLWQRGTTLYY
jgi:hypothetical protein